jgi:hypothetical protein
MKNDTEKPRQVARQLSDEQLAELMSLLKGSNSLELKLTVPASAHRSTIQGLPMDPVEAQPRQVYFFDTPDLDLNKAGVVVRARRRQGGVGDTVVKLRPVVPEDLPADLRRNPMFNVEVDVLPGGYVCSASFKGRTTGQKIWKAVSEKGRLSKVFSKEQRAFYDSHAPDGLDMDSLLPLGPTFILKAQFAAQTAKKKSAPKRLIVAEVWLYPDGSRIMELSTKARPADAFTAAAEARDYLEARGVPVNGVQETKTKAALQFYARQLARPE